MHLKRTTSHLGLNKFSIQKSLDKLVSDLKYNSNPESRRGNSKILLRNKQFINEYIKESGRMKRENIQKKIKNRYFNILFSIKYNFIKITFIF